MSLYQQLSKIGERVLRKSTLFKYGFNLSPMYRRSTARILYVADNLQEVRIKLPISYKNRNYVNSIFGGSMFSAVDPIPMVQLIHILGTDYVVWDKSAEIRFRRPARENLYATFIFTEEQIAQIKVSLQQENETEFIHNTELTNKDGDKVFCEVSKRIYITTKKYYKEKQAKRALEKAQN